MIARIRKTRFWTLAPMVLFPLWGALALAQGNNDALSPATQRELAAARRATAKYHDIAQAKADGYVDINSL